MEVSLLSPSWLLVYRLTIGTVTVPVVPNLPIGILESYVS